MHFAFNTGGEGKSLRCAFAELSELEKSFSSLGFSYSDFLQCKAGGGSKIAVEVYEKYTFCIFGSAPVKAAQGEFSAFALFIQSKAVLFVPLCESERLKKEFASLINKIEPENACAERLVYFILNKVIKGKREYIEQAQIRASKLEEYIIKDMAGKDFNLNLHYMKKETLLLRNYFEQFYAAVQILFENSNGVFQNSNLRCLNALKEKTRRLCSLSQALSDSLGQLGDAYDSNLNYKLNNIMKLFTVISAMFYPLTLIVGWYGMNFKSMPEFEWRHGYAAVIALSIFVVCALAVFFKRKKWL